MSALPSAFAPPTRRRLARFRAGISLEVTVLRSGVPRTLPGRCVDLGAGGLGAVVAGELFAGETVGLAISLPGLRDPFYARAKVRYQERIRCGLELVLAQRSQPEEIGVWIRNNAPPAVSPIDVVSAVVRNPEPPSFLKATQAEPSRRRLSWWRVATGVSLLMFAVLSGWYLYARGIPMLRAKAARARAVTVPAAAPVTRIAVPSDVMQSLLLRRVMPEYPEAALQAGVEARVLLHAVIGQDGTVTELRAVDGPEVLRAAALQAVQQWRFEPFLMNGAAAEVDTTIEVEFRLRP